MTREEFIRCTANAVDQIAHDALLEARWQGTTKPVELVCEVAEALDRNSLLPQRTQAQRLGILLRRLKLDRDELLPLAQAAREFPAHLRVTVANSLPASARLKVYGSQRSVPASRANEAEIRAETATRLPEEDHSGRAGTEANDRLGYSTILLFSHPDHQDANRKLLKDSGLDPMIVETLDEMREVLATNTDVCACVIDQSELALLDESEQTGLFRTLAGYSSFLAIRVHDAGGLLVTRDDVLAIIKTERRLATPVPHEAISFQPDGTIRGSELSFYQNAAMLLQSHEKAAIVLGDLTSRRVHLLVAAARARVRAEGLDTELDLRPLTVRFLQGGLSGATLTTVMCGETPTFVAKITSKEGALDEILRYRTFVQPWIDELRPECHFHGEDAVILFTLVRGDGDHSYPAEPLANRLANLWNRQWMGTDRHCLEEEAKFLGRGLKRVAMDLAKLNRNPSPPGVDIQSFVNPPATLLDELERDGFVWGFDERAVKARLIAADRFRTMATLAVVHGDIHLRNVLIRGESEVHLIDYAASGPGHPAVDLVRYELALYLGPARQFEESSSSVNFQKAISIERVSAEVLRGRFKAFFQCYVNAACAEGIVAARDTAIGVLQSYGGDSRDYLAVKFLVAWQNLAIIGAQTGLARAVIEAIADEVNDNGSPSNDT